MEMNIEDYDSEDYYNQDVVPLSSLSEKYARRISPSSHKLGFLDHRNKSISSCKLGFLQHRSSPRKDCVARKQMRFLDLRSSPEKSDSSSELGFLEPRSSDPEKGCITWKQKSNHYSFSRELDHKASPSSVLAYPFITSSSSSMSDHSSSSNNDEGIAIARNLAEKKEKVIPYPDDAVLPQESEEAIKKMGGEEAALVIQKRLEKTDTYKNENRFPIPFSSASRFLKGYEIDLFESHKKEEHVKSDHIMKVLFMDTKGKVWTNLTLRQWKKFYALATYWHPIIQDNELSHGMVVQLWSFRVKSQLCFAMVKVSDA